MRPSRQKIICEVIDLRNPPEGQEVEAKQASELNKTLSPTTSQSLEPRSTSPTPSVVSVTPSIREAACVWIDGNLYSAHGIYPLPFELNTQQDCAHQCVKIFLRGKLCPESTRIDEVLRDDGEGEQKTILDLGCGRGHWSFEMATLYPHCSVVGVDLVPLPESEKDRLPPNFRMEMDDINLGLDHFYGQFDVVHARSIATGIKDYPQLIDEISRVLRPGGLMVLVEYDYQAIHHNRKPVEKHPIWHPQHSWFPVFSETLAQTIQNVGGDPYVGSKLLSYVEEHGAFDDIGSYDVVVPLYPWYPNPMNEDQVLANIAGTAMSRRTEDFMSSRLIKTSGLNECMSAEVLRGMKAEMGRAVHHNKLGAALNFVWARKPEGEMKLT